MFASDLLRSHHSCIHCTYLLVPLSSHQRQQLLIKGLIGLVPKFLSAFSRKYNFPESRAECLLLFDLSSVFLILRCPDFWAIHCLPSSRFSATPPTPSTWTTAGPSAGPATTRSPSWHRSTSAAWSGLTINLHKIKSARLRCLLYPIQDYSGWNQN